MTESDIKLATESEIKGTQHRALNEHLNSLREQLRQVRRHYDPKPVSGLEAQKQAGLRQDIMVLEGKIETLAAFGQAIGLLPKWVDPQRYFQDLGGVWNAQR